MYVCMWTEKDKRHERVHKDVWERFWNAWSTKFAFRLSFSQVSKGQKVTMYHELSMFICPFASLHCPHHQVLMVGETGTEWFGQWFSNLTVHFSPVWKYYWNACSGSGVLGQNPIFRLSNRLPGDATPRHHFSSETSEQTRKPGCLCSQPGSAT